MTDTEKKAIEDLLRALISKENALDFCISTVEKCEINDSELADRADLIKNLQDMKTGVQEYIRELADRIIGQYYFKKPEWDEMPFKGIGEVFGKYIADASILVVEKKKVLSAVESVKDELLKEKK